MAKVAQKGSAMVRYFREQKERKRAQKKEWQLAGTRIGEVMGVKAPDEPDEQWTADSHRQAQTFADKVGDMKSEAVSEFATQKTIAEQRQYLPVFSVRSSLLRMIKEHQVKLLTLLSSSQALVDIIVVVLNSVKRFSEAFYHKV